MRRLSGVLIGIIGAAFTAGGMTIIQAQLPLVVGLLGVALMVCGISAMIWGGGMLLGVER